MAAINKQSILKAFYLFDKKQIPLTNVEGAPVGDTRDVGARKELCQMWLDAFEGLDKDVWDKVIDVVQNTCKEYPSIEKIYQIIEHLASPCEPEPVEEKQPEPAPPPSPAENKKTKKTSSEKKIQAMFELAKQGRFLDARSIVHSASISPEKITSYAKAHWPDCSAEWIGANKHELEELAQREETCKQCFSVHTCPTRGYYSYGQIDKYTGAVSVMMARCMKSRKDDAK